MIDKLGLMEPGTICPNHYIKWRYGDFNWCLIFKPLSVGRQLMHEFYLQRERKKHFQEDLSCFETKPQLAKTMGEIKIDAILEALAGNNYNAHAACRELKISKAMLYRQLNRYSITINREINKKGKVGKL